MDAEGHRVWRYAALAWITLVAVPTGYAVIRWQMGLGRDPDMSGVGELIFSFLFVISFPMAALAFGVLAPLTIAYDSLAKGRAPMYLNVLVGAGLAVPALVVSVLAVGWPQHGLRDSVSALRHLDRADGFAMAVLLGGMIAGLGVRYRQRATTHVGGASGKGQSDGAVNNGCSPM
jgi:hypothetical protein